MGPNHTRDQELAQGGVGASLWEKGDRIATLEARLEAYSARASTAHTRLLKTIDVLDALRSQHALEISAEQRARTKLAHEVDRLRTVAKNLEVEKDELKDVVEDLIEKAGCTSRNMQRGNLNVALAEQVAVGAMDGTKAKEDHDNDLLAYATSIIARLRMELDFEKQRHSKTVEEANLRIEELEAKVAVREAELENCITSPDPEHHPEPRDISTQGSKRQSPGRRLPEPKPLSDEDCLRFLESNNARNRSLEIEIRRIAEKLEQARMAATTPSSSCKEPQSPAPRNGHPVVPTPSPRPRSASVDPSALSLPPSVGNAAATPRTPPPSAIAQLDNQIRAMTTHMDALVSERTTLIESAARRRRAMDGLNIDTFEDVLRVEAECVRLQAEVDGLRDQLQYTRIYARSREKAFLHQIAQLRASSSSSPAPHPVPDLYHIFSPKPLEDDIAAEESVELALPLLPTVFPTPSFCDPHADTDLLSLPFSPKRTPSPASPPTPQPPARQSPGSQDIERAQAALDSARAHLVQKEEALAQLRAEMERLQLEAQAQTRADGDRDHEPSV